MQLLLSSCVKRILTPINHFDTKASKIGDIRLGKIYSGRIFKQLGCTIKDKSSSHIEGNHIQSKFLMSQDSSIKVGFYATSFLRVRYRCSDVSLRNYEYYVIDSISIPRNSTVEQIIFLLGTPTQCTFSDSIHDIYYEFDGCFSAVEIFVYHSGEESYIMEIMFFSAGSF